MKPKVLCSECSNELQPGDKFCGKCGAKVEQDAAAENSPTLPYPSREKPKPSAGTLRCSLCGHESPSNAITCESCGAPIQSAAEARKKTPAGAASPAKNEPVPFTFLTSWRLTVTLAVILVATVIILELTKKGEAPAEKTETTAPAQSSGLSDLSMKEMAALEQTVADKPDDAPAWLRLSNMLQDARLFPKAVASYGKYLALKPEDADATVDLGVTYYEFAISDSTKRMEYLSQAQINFEKALKENPRHQLAMFNLGIVSLQNGDMPGANSWFMKCASVDTSTDTGKKAEMMIHQHTFSQQ